MDLNVEIEIDMDDVEFIMGTKFKDFTIFIKNVYCNFCKSAYSAEIVDYKIFLTPNGDLTLDGKCGKCLKRVVRCIETGEDQSNYDRAMHIRKIKIELLNDYKKRP